MILEKIIMMEMVLEKIKRRMKINEIFVQIGAEIGKVCHTGFNCLSSGRVRYRLYLKLCGSPGAILSYLRALFYSSRAGLASHYLGADSTWHKSDFCTDYDDVLLSAWKKPGADLGDIPV